MTFSSNPPQPSRILVVDDDERNRRLLDALLVPEGYEVLEAADGPTAIEIVGQHRVDLVLMDVMMPTVDGIETCRRIRVELGRVDLPVIFVTALADRASRIRGKEVGGDEFLTKPIDETELLVRVRNLLQVKAYHDLRERHREWLEHELEKRSIQLIHADRLATLGTLAAGVGHELNNITMVMITYLSLVRQRASRGLPAADEDIENLVRVGEHLKLHASHLLSLGRPGPDHSQRMDLREIVSGTMAMLRAVGRTRNIDVVAELPEEPVMVTVNRTRIEQVIVNLVGNAADALASTRRRPRRIRVTLSRGTEHSRVECRVEDNGAGMPSTVLDNIFEPYFTTKPAGRGTGLGLPVVKQIVESYGGTVVVSSVENEGTTVAFDLPGAAMIDIETAAPKVKE